MKDGDGWADEILDMAGARFELIARTGTGDADTVLFRATMPPGKSVPLHSHADPEAFYVIGGRIDVFVADASPGWRAVEAGRSLVVTDGMKHAVRNPADRPADLILATTGRLARFFRDVGRPVGPGDPALPPTAADAVRIARTARAYGYWLASPAESATVTG